jgi:hypothetical protein
MKPTLLFTPSEKGNIMHLDMSRSAMISCKDQAMAQWKPAKAQWELKHREKKASIW